MLRNLKTLGLSLVAILAMAAMGSASASAQEFDAHGVSSASVHAEQEVGNEHVFTIEGSEVECETATFVTPENIGEEEVPTNELTVHPEYDDCTAFGFEATVDTGDCNYTIFANGDINIVDENCMITIDAVSCQVVVHGGQELTGLSFNNLPTEPSTVQIVADVGGIAATKTEDGFLCPLEGKGEAIGTYEGNTIATGESEGEQVGITHIP